MRRRSVIFGFVCLSLIIIGLPNSSAQEIIFSEDFESGCVGWYADNGVWECGTPTNGPGQCYAGTGCAGTIFDGNYPNNIDSRFIYALPHIPAIQLPEVTAEEEIHLRFQQWFSYYPYLPHSKDTAQVQVQVYDEGTGWSAWQDIDDWQQDRSGGWSLKSVELNEYAGLKVRVGF